MGILVILLQITAVFFLIRDGFRGITDTSRIINEAISMVGPQNGVLDNEQDYFARYGNTYPFTILMYYICRGIHFWGINSYEPVLMILNIILIDISGVFALHLAEMLRGRIMAIRLLFLFLICPTTYEWIAYTYTNTFSMPFVMGTLYFGIKTARKRKGRIKNIILAGVLGAIGYQIRATTIIPLIAVLLGIVISQKIKSAKQKCILILITLAIFIGTATGSSIICQNHLKNKTIDRTFPITHWLMIGVNTEYNGSTNAEDVNFSMSFPSKKEKVKGNLNRIKERLAKMGPVGYIVLTIKKMQYVWGDGTDGCLRYYTSGEDISLLHSYLYGDRSGVAILYRQIFRSGTFLFALIGVIYQLRKKVLDEFFVISLCAFGAILFFILWEANSKYNISFMELFLLLMADGICCVKRSVRWKPKRFGEIARVQVKEVVFMLLAVIPLCLTSLMILDRTYYTSNQSVYRDVKIQNSSWNEEFISLKNKGEFACQTFTTGKTFNEVRVLTKPEQHINAGSYRFELSDEHGNVLFVQEFPKQNEKTMKWQEFDVPEIYTDDNVRQYKIKIICIKKLDKGMGLRLGITPYKTYDLYTGGKFMVNSSEYQQDMTFSISWKECRSHMGIAEYVSVGMLIWLLFGILLVIVLRQQR